MLDEGRYGSVTELAAGEKLERGYLGRILMLTLLAPDIVEAIMDGRQPAELGVHVLREGFPVEWGEQLSTAAEKPAKWRRKSLPVLVGFPCSVGGRFLVPA